MTTEPMTPADQRTQGAPLRIMLVYGTRPEAIKVAPLINRMRADERHEGAPEHEPTAQQRGPRTIVRRLRGRGGRAPGGQHGLLGHGAPLGGLVRGPHAATS